MIKSTNYNVRNVQCIAVDWKLRIKVIERGNLKPISVADSSTGPETNCCGPKRYRGLILPRYCGSLAASRGYTLFSTLMKSWYLEESRLIWTRTASITSWKWLDGTSRTDAFSTTCRVTRPTSWSLVANSLGLAWAARQSTMVLKFLFTVRYSGVHFPDCIRV